MRLIRTAAYILLGYAIFELVAGMFEDPEAAAEDAGATPVDPERTGWERQGRGNARGVTGLATETSDANGAVSRVRVGRGIMRS